MPIYNQLIQHGFRRSGGHSYRPHCQTCQACIACRIPVKQFRPNRSQQRCLKKNKDLVFSVVDACFTQEYFELYCLYLNSRHVDGTMANPAEEDFRQFLYSDWCDTQFIELRLDDQLVAIAVTDMMSDGLSAVY
jgi:arginine-tRNA-protein transferase